jgi:ClpP class serine protease
MNRLDEVMERLGSRPAMVRMEDVSQFFGDAAPYRIEDGIAMIDIVGVLSNAAWSWGGTTYGELQNQIRIACADPNVDGILFNVNSPGGETDNAFETAALIASAEKPCWAVAGTAAYSAAYLLASQCDKLYCSPTSGGVGSMGIFLAHMDHSKALEQAGVKVTLQSAGAGKTDGNPFEPLSPAALENRQTEIDRQYGELVGAVAKGRGILPQNVVKLGARPFYGSSNAIASGLADASGDLSTAWTEMRTDIERASTGAPSFMLMRMQTSSSSVASATGNKGEVQPMTDTKTVQAEAKVPPPAEIEAMVSQAAQTGRAEAALIASMCAIAGKPGMVAEFLTSGKTTAQVGTELLAAKVAAEKTLDPSVIPSAEAQAAAKIENDKKQNQPEGKAKPWSEIMGKLAGNKGAK